MIRYLFPFKSLMTWLVGLGICLPIALSSLDDSFAQEAQVKKRAYIVPTKRLKELTPSMRPMTLASQNDLSYVEMTEAQVQALGEAVHKDGFRCGGFMEAEAEVSLGLSPTKILQQSLAPLPIQLAPEELGFKVRFSETVKAHLGKAQLSRAQATMNQLISYNDRHSSSTTGSQAVTELRDNLQAFATSKQRKKIKFELIATPGRSQPSLVVSVPGTQPKLPGLVIGGHIDTLATNKPGADDDASGSSAVAEIYRSLLDSGLRFRRTVHFAFYAAEEVGLVGSQAVVSSFSSRKIPVRAALQFDMVGYNSPNDSLPIYMIGDNTHPGLTQFVRDLAKEYLGIAQTGTTLCDYACSDHARWYQAGIPVAFPFESSFENSNNQIHTAGDTVARLDWDHVMNFVKLGLAFAIELGEPTNPDTCFLCRFSK